MTNGLTSLSPVVCVMFSPFLPVASDLCIIFSFFFSPSGVHFKAARVLKRHIVQISLRILKPVWNDRIISLSFKMRLMCSLVTPIFLYACESRTLTAKKNTSHGNELLPQDTMHLLQRSCYQRGNLCQDPAGNRTSWTCLSLVRSSQNHLAKHSERGKKTRQTEEEVGRQHQGMDRPGIRRAQEGTGEQRKMGESGFEIICGAPTTLAVKG